jgi:6-pyruvoyltetrahydropterin/6-carboxytetrahydropterin synthase
MLEISKQFRFESAHTLHRDGDKTAVANLEQGSSRRIHGHSYRAEVVVRGEVDPATGMVVDFGVLERAVEEARLGLDHHFLNEVPGLGPATMENLSIWIWRKVSGSGGSPGRALARVTVHRDSTGETCSYFGPQAKG